MTAQARRGHALEQPDELFDVDVKALHFGAYNRPVAMPHVHALADAYRERPWAMPAIEANMREDGILYVVNGQHRTMAARCLNWPTISAVVHFGWTEAEEAQSHRDTARARRMTALDRWHSAKLAGEPDVLAVDYLVLGMGLHIPRKVGESRKVGAIVCPDALMSVAYGTFHGVGHERKQFTLRHLHLTLEFIVGAWPDGSGRFHSLLVVGIGKWLYKWANNPAFSIGAAQRKLSTYGPDEVLRRTRALAHGEGIDTSAAIGHTLTRLYDSGRRTGRLVPKSEE